VIIVFDLSDLIHRMDAVVLWKSDWDESKHPRADNGQFGSGSGSSGSSKKPAATPKQKKPKASRSAYGIDPKIHQETALDLIESRARHGDIGSNQAEQVGIRSAVYGIKYALNTGRLHGYADITVRQLTGGQMSKLVEELSQKGIMEGEVPRYLNQKFSAPT